MPPDLLFDYFGVRLNGPQAAGKTINLHVDFTDIAKQYSLVVESGVLNYANKFVDTPDAKLTLKSVGSISVVVPVELMALSRHQSRR